MDAVCAPQCAPRFPSLEKRPCPSFSSRASHTYAWPAESPLHCCKMVRTMSAPFTFILDDCLPPSLGYCRRCCKQCGWNGRGDREGWRLEMGRRGRGRGKGEEKGREGSAAGNGRWQRKAKIRSPFLDLPTVRLTLLSPLLPLRFLSLSLSLTHSLTHSLCVKIENLVGGWYV